jgi:hypothetical protein
VPQPQPPIQIIEQRLIIDRRDRELGLVAHLTVLSPSARTTNSQAGRVSSRTSFLTAARRVSGRGASSSFSSSCAARAA